MFPYLCLAVFPVIFGVLYSLGKTTGINSDEKSKKTFLIVVGIAMFLMIALRSKYNGSTDSFNYYYLWREVSKLSIGNLPRYAERSPMESGFVISAGILAQIFPNPQYVFVFSGAFFAISVCRFIYKNCDDVIIGTVMFITLGLYGFMIQGMRQAVAMSICLFAIEWCKKRKFLPFVALVLFATLYHISAMVFLMVYFLYGLKSNGITALGFALFVGLLIAFSDLIIAFGNQLLESEYGVEVESGGMVASAVYILITVAAILVKKRGEENKNYTFYIYFTILGMIFYLMRYFGAQVLERISFYFMFGQIALLPSALNNLPVRERSLMKIITVVLCWALYAYRLTTFGDYKFFWQ